MASPFTFQDASRHKADAVANASRAVVLDKANGKWVVKERWEVAVGDFVKVGRLVVVLLLQSILCRGVVPLVLHCSRRTGRCSSSGVCGRAVGGGRWGELGED